MAEVDIPISGLRMHLKSCTETRGTSRFRFPQVDESCGLGPKEAAPSHGVVQLQSAVWTASPNFGMHPGPGEQRSACESGM